MPVTRYSGLGVHLHVRARFSASHVNAILLLPTSRADLDPTKGWVGVRVRVRVGSGMGSGWSGQRNRRFVRTCAYGAAIHKSLFNSRANPNSLARTCNFAGAGYNAFEIAWHGWKLPVVAVCGVYRMPL